MSRKAVHFEVFIRKYPDSDWTLNSATEDRVTALDSAKELVAAGQAAAARVSTSTTAATLHSASISR